MSGASGFRRRDYHEPPAPPPPQIAPAPDDDGHPTGIAPGAGPAVSVAPSARHRPHHKGSQDQGREQERRKHPVARGRVRQINRRKLARRGPHKRVGAPPRSGSVPTTIAVEVVSANATSLRASRPSSSADNSWLWSSTGPRARRERVPLRRRLRGEEQQPEAEPRPHGNRPGAHARHADAGTKTAGRPSSQRSRPAPSRPPPRTPDGGQSPAPGQTTPWGRTDRRVVPAHGLVVVAPRHGNAVLGAFELGLQVVERRRGLRVVF
jgi:hypothetical protein